MIGLLDALNYIREISIIVLLILLSYFIVKFGNKYLGHDRELHISKKQIIISLLLLIFIITTYYVFSDNGLREIIFTIFISIIIAYVINPLVNILEDKKVNRVYGVLLVYLVILGTIYLMSVLIFPAIFNEIKNLVNLLPKYSNNVSNFVNDLYNDYYKNIKDLPFGLDEVKGSIEENITKVQNILIDGIKGSMDFIISFFSKAINIFLIPIIAFYLVKDKDYFKKNIEMTIPKKSRSEIINLSRKIDYSLGNFVRGQFIIALFVGTFTAIGLLVLGVNYALTIGLISGVMNIIPYFGPIIGGAIAMLFALLESPLKAVWVLILFIIIQQLEGNILQPKIMGDKVGLHPVIIIIALLIGGNLMGILGMLLAIPVTTTLKIVLSHILQKTSEM
ncbi:AI-2E family transporter [Clostridium sp. D2Q-11]|uniref:AI-2E family transporter n=1 Tax=Anaeromonas frigoriresistens TaxID=2683708 RepID=A0A942UXQ9_9FIRM|nr:AI-2E family transporter [Anaeromonas frigoriresistens]MBS4540045.1 AI-2E family transporter [Anaeromonas frigoriresistens]